MKKVMSIMMATLVSASVFATTAPTNGKTSATDSSANTQTEALQQEKAKLEAENETLKLELGYTKMMSKMLLKLKDDTAVAVAKNTNTQKVK